MYVYAVQQRKRAETEKGITLEKAFRRALLVFLCAQVIISAVDGHLYKI